MFAEILHGAAIVSTGLGACCMVVQHRARRARLWDAAMAIGMVAAMVCTAAGWGPPILWSAAMVTFALAVLPFAPRRGEKHRAMIAFDAFGAVLMAVLMIAMSVGAQTGASSASSHHGPPPIALAGGLALAVLGYSGRAAILVHRGTGAVARVRPLAMGGAVLLMGVAALALGDTAG